MSVVNVNGKKVAIIYLFTRGKINYKGSKHTKALKPQQTAPNRRQHPINATNSRFDQVVFDVLQGLLELAQRHVHAVVVEVVVAVVSKPA